MKCINFYNEMSGGAKTVGTIIAAYILASHYGKKVLVIDLGLSNDTSDFLCLDRGDMPLGTIGDLLIATEANIRDFISPTENKNIDFIRGTQMSISSEEEIESIKKLKGHLVTIDMEYDYCLIDSGNANDRLSQNGLIASDIILIPMRCDRSSLYGLEKSMKTIHILNSKAKVGGCYFGRYSGVDTIQKHYYDLLQKGQTDFIEQGIEVDDDFANALMMKNIKLEADMLKNKKVMQDYLSLMEGVLEKIG